MDHLLSCPNEVVMDAISMATTMPMLFEQSSNINQIIYIDKSEFTIENILKDVDINQTRLISALKLLDRYYTVLKHPLHKFNWIDIGDSISIYLRIVLNDASVDDMNSHGLFIDTYKIDRAYDDSDDSHVNGLCIIF